MPLFSQRNNPSAKKVFKTKDNMFLDDDIRIKIWNCFYKHLRLYFQQIISTFWVDVLIQPINVTPFVIYDKLQYTNHERIFMNWFSDLEWENIFDLIEIADYISAMDEYRRPLNERFVDEINDIFQEENIGYRLSNGEFIPVSSIEEVEEIEKAQLTGIEQVNYHLDKAIHHLSDRERPDYSNSIKESIHAVEFVCRSITGASTLGRAILCLEKKGININAQFKDSLSKLYDYTNDKNGIRHALMNKDTTIDQEEARFMLVACSTFINYFIVKADKAGLTIQ